MPLTPDRQSGPRFIFVTGGVVSSLGKGIAAASIGRLLVSRGFTRRAAEVRSVHQRRPGHDVALPARRGLRDRGRRRDRPRPRPLRALHRRQHDARVERHRGRHLQRRDPPRAARRLPRRDGPGRAAHHRRDQAADLADRPGDRRRLRHHRDRRHGRRHRVAAVPRGDPPVPGRRRPAALHVHPPHARAVHQPRGRAEDQADAALGQRAAAHRHPAGHARLPLGVGRSRATSARRSRCSRACRSRRSSRPTTSRTSTRCRSASTTRASTTSCSSTSASRRRAADLDGWRALIERAAEATRAGADRDRRQVRRARGRLPLGRRGAAPRRLHARRPRSRSTGSTPRRCSTSASDRRGGAQRLAGADGILIPGGFGSRGFEGKIEAARFARESGVPYLGICFGMHVAVCEFARNVAGMEGANSTECDPETPFPVIDLLPEQKEIADLGGTMRLGADPIKLHDGTRAREIYGEAVIYERHRHRYEVNNMLRKRLEAAGLVMSGTSPDERLVEIVELTDHPFFVASQFHPEFKSRPERPAPLFREFVGARSTGASSIRRRASSARLAARAVRTAPRDARPRPARPSAGAARSDTFAGSAPSTARPVRERGCARLGARRARRARTSRSRRTAPAPRSAVTAATCSRGSPAAATGRCCSARISTPCRRGADRAGGASTAAGRTPTTRSSAPTTRPPSRCMLVLARRLVAEPAERRRRAAVHGRRGARAARREGVRDRRAAQQRRLHVRQRRCRSAASSSASPTHYRVSGRAARRRRARRRQPRGRAQRDPRRRPRDRRDAPRAARSARPPRTSARSPAAAPPTSSLTAAASSARRAASTRTRAEQLASEHRRMPDRRRERPRMRMRPRRDGSSASSRATACAPSSARGGARLRRAARLRLRAGAGVERRRQRRQRAARTGSPCSTSATAPSATTSRPSASRSRRSRACSTSPSRSSPAGTGERGTRRVARARRARRCGARARRCGRSARAGAGRRARRRRASRGRATWRCSAGARSATR